VYVTSGGAGGGGATPFLLGDAALGDAMPSGVLPVPYTDRRTSKWTLDGKPLPVTVIDVPPAAVTSGGVTAVNSHTAPATYTHAT
jgi:hypothetical protein